MERNFLLTVAYDGTGFYGWQRQPGRPTVQGALEQAIGAAFSKTVRVHGAGRTDAGVHAYGQRAGFAGDFGIPVERLAPVINHRLTGSRPGNNQPGPIRILAAEEKPIGFHVRFDAKGKKYLYRIRNTEEVDIFQRNYEYLIPGPLDTDRMREAAAGIVGTHDFKCFQAAGGEERATTVRTIESLDIAREGGSITIAVTGDGFLYHMVRIITGTLVEVAQGKRRPEDLAGIIESGDRQQAGHTAPPQGLYLAEVYYEAGEVKNDGAT